jgi:hypothetical protein
VGGEEWQRGGEEGGCAVGVLRPAWECSEECERATGWWDGYDGWVPGRCAVVAQARGSAVVDAGAESAGVVQGKQWAARTAFLVSDDLIMRLMEGVSRAVGLRVLEEGFVGLFAFVPAAAVGSRRGLVRARVLARRGGRRGVRRGVRRWVRGASGRSCGCCR